MSSGDNNLAMFSPELRLVLLCARTGGADEGAIQEHCSKQNLDWARLLRLARDHHVVSLAHLNLSRVPAGLVPAETLGKLREQTQLIAGRNMFLVRELLSISSRLSEQNIPMIAFKGPMLAAGVYGNLGLRSCGDLDLLVREDDVQKIKKSLVATGMRPIFPTSTEQEIQYLLSLDDETERAYFHSHWEYHLLRDDWLNVDLHWRIMPPEMSLEFNHEELWQRSMPLNVAGKSIPGLSLEDQLLVLCANGTKDCWNRLDRVCDVAEVIREKKLDWDYILRSARQMGARRVLLLGLNLAKQLLGEPLPSDVQAMIARNASRIGALTEQVKATLAREKEDVELLVKREKVMFHIRARERIRDRIRCGLNYVASPSVGDWAAVRLPPALSFLYVFIRPFRLLGKLGSSATAFPR